jgi:hypothetical protein
MVSLVRADCVCSCLPALMEPVSADDGVKEYRVEYCKLVCSRHAVENTNTNTARLPLHVQYSPAIIRFEESWCRADETLKKRLDSLPCLEVSRGRGH